MKVKVMVECGAAKAWETVAADHAVWAGAALIAALGGGRVEYQCENDGEWTAIDRSELPLQKLAGYNAKYSNCPAYYVGDSDQITIGVVTVMGGRPVDGSGAPIDADPDTRTIVGYKHGICQSYCNGSLLVPLSAAW